MQYSGNSPQKAARRAWAYGDLKRCDFLRKKHIIIASRECGDIHFLKEHGVSGNNIIACDTDPIAIREAHWLGAMHSPHSDIANTVSWALDQFGASEIASINVDLCDGLRAGLIVLQEIFDILDYVPDGNKIPVWLTFFRGRQDRFHSDKARRQHARRNLPTHWQITKYDDYTSWSSTNIGSPMCLMQLSSTRKGKGTMTTAAAKKAWKTRNLAAKKAKSPAKGKNPGKTKPTTKPKKKKK